MRALALADYSMWFYFIIFTFSFALLKTAAPKSIAKINITFTVLPEIQNILVVFYKSGIFD